MRTQREQRQRKLYALWLKQYMSQYTTPDGKIPPPTSAAVDAFYGHLVKIGVRNGPAKYGSRENIPDEQALPIIEQELAKLQQRAN